MLGEDNQWIPACTLLMGLPGERREDIVETLKLLDDIKDYKSLIVPLNFVSMKGSPLSGGKSFRVKDMLPEHWQLLGECIEHDARLARKLKNNLKMGNPITKRAFDMLSDYLIKSVEKYAHGMKKGNPPKNYEEICQDYTTPNVLDAG